jgi:CheY-like chemotaxis protein
VKLRSAMRGLEGLELARVHRPDLILLDLQLPDTSGEEVLRALRADPATRATPVLVLSADATEGRVESMLAAGASGYLTKPLDVAELLERIDALMGASGERAEG